MKTVFGEVVIAVPRRSCNVCGKYFIDSNFAQNPLSRDLQSACNVTPSLRRIATFCGASWPYEQAEKIVHQLTGVSLSHNQIKNLCANEAKAILTATETIETNPLFAPRWGIIDSTANYAQPTLVFDSNQLDNTQMTPQHKSQYDRFYIGLDGVLINNRPKNRRIEAKVGILFTDDRATISKNRNLLLNKQYVGSFSGIEVFRQRLFDAAVLRGAFEAEELILLGDGASWIWNLAQKDYPHARLVLDWWHLKKRLSEAIREAKRFGVSNQQTQSWYQHLSDQLWIGDVELAKLTLENLCSSLQPFIERAPPPGRILSEIPKFYRYLQNNQSQIVNYELMKQHGYFISSVFVEKANDILVCPRQKLRGQNWSRSGAENVVVLRQLILNNQWDWYWHNAQAA